jgi:hypothetical protein
MKAIETNVTLTEHAQVTPENEKYPHDTPIEEIRESIYRGWQDALAGRTKPVSLLWDGLDVD